MRGSRNYVEGDRISDSSDRRSDVARSRRQRTYAADSSRRHSVVDDPAGAAAADSSPAPMSSRGAAVDVDLGRITGTGHNITWFSLFTPSDTIHETLVKGIIASVTIGTSFFSIVSLVVWVISIAEGTCLGLACVGYYIAAFFPIAVSIVETILLLYCRRIQAAPNFVIDIFLLTHAVFLCITTLVVPAFPGLYMCSMSIFASIVCYTPRVLLQFLVQSIVWWICAVIEAQLETGSTTPSLFPYSIQPNATSAYIYVVVAYLATCLMAYGVGVIVSMYETQSMVFENTRVMGHTVRERLHKYDAEGAKKILEPYLRALRTRNQRSGGDAGGFDEDSFTEEKLKVDNEVLTSLVEMTRRMSLLRAHLPNWVIQLHASPTDAETAPVVTNPDPPLPLDLDLSGPFEALQNATFERVTFVLLDFGFDTVRILTTSLSPSHVLTEFVDKIFIHLNEAQGSLHSAVGDFLFVTFNATNHVTAPEIAAVTFATRLRSDTSNLYALINGSVSTTDARCQVAGSRGSSAALLISSKTKMLPTQLLHISRDAQCIVADAATNAKVKHIFESRSIDAVWVRDSPHTAWMLQPDAVHQGASLAAVLDGVSLDEPSSSGDGVLLNGLVSSNSSSPSPLRRLGAREQLVYQIVKDKRHRGGSGWSYVVDRSPGDVLNRQVTAATIKCVEGLYDDALAILNRLPQDVRSDVPIQRLQRAAMWCNEKAVPRGFFSRRQPLNYASSMKKGESSDIDDSSRRTPTMQVVTDD